MLYIAHRINTTKALKNTPFEYGVELDLRDRADRLIIYHDAFGDGEDFEEYIQNYNHRLLIANVKCEGLEQRVLDILNTHQIQNFFFLDLSFPALIKLVRQGEHRIAVRVSEFEPLEQALALKGKVDWVWVDCFTKFPLEVPTYQQLKPHFKLCLVSPELQGHPLDRIQEFKEYMNKMPFDAVCTKRPDLWK
ncbi:MAG: hypothetical protein HQM12_16760 [SAR324 cluster bacterium]|nr:hypothetical protein [SAR324 cluster bacterium]